MPSFEEEAFARAAQLHRREERPRERHAQPGARPAEPPKPEPAPKSEPVPKPEPAPKPVPKEPAPVNMMDALLGDRDKSLILLLLMLLTDSNKDPSLLFALFYLLM